MKKALIWVIILLAIGGVAYGGYKMFWKGSPEVATTTVKEKNQIESNSYETLQEISTFPEEVSMKSGESIELDLMGEYLDEPAARKLEKSLLTGDEYKDIKVTTLDKNVVTASLVQINKDKIDDPESKKAKYKIRIKAHKEPKGSETKVVVTYTDKRTKEEFETTIPIFLEDQKKLTNKEIRTVMDKYIDMFNVSTDFLTDKNIYAPEDVSIHMDEYEKTISTFATKRYMKDNKTFLRDYLSVMGEGEFTPNYDVRFDVLENKPSKVVVKSVLEPMIYGADYNVYADNFYITAIKENGNWLIDEVKKTEAPEDPVNFTWDEYEKFLNQTNVNLNYLGQIKMNADIGYDANWNPVRRKTTVFLVEGEFTDGIDGITAASGNVVDIPEELLPENLRPKQEKVQISDITWNSYSNVRYGYRVEYPDTWNIGREADNGDGVALYSGEHGEVVIYGSMSMFLDENASPENYDEVEVGDTHTQFQFFRLGRGEYGITLYGNVSNEFYETNREIFEYMINNLEIDHGWKAPTSKKVFPFVRKI